MIALIAAQWDSRECSSSPIAPMVPINSATVKCVEEIKDQETRPDENPPTRVVPGDRSVNKL